MITNVYFYMISICYLHFFYYNFLLQIDELFENGYPPLLRMKYVILLFNFQSFLKNLNLEFCGNGRRN